MLLRCPNCKLVLYDYESNGICMDCQTEMEAEWKLTTQKEE